MKNAYGFTALEMVTVTGIIGIAVAVATPSIIKANRSYQLNTAAQEVCQAFESARFEAIRNNNSQTVLFDQANNTITIYGRVIQLPAGVSFQTQASNNVPNTIKTAATNGANGTLPGQETNERAAVSFPLRTADNVNVATFNSRGMPSVQPGILNWVYLVNSNDEKVAVTLSSAGSMNVWRQKDSSTWIDSAGNPSTVSQE